jgi:hypothetical protein
MKVDRETLLEAMCLYVLNNAEPEGLTDEELAQAINNLSDEEKLDALARYQEHVA